MRLIDADRFKKFLQALCKAGAPYDEVIQLLDKEPTAYDVEKVVAELEKEQEALKTDMWAKESNNWYGQYCNGMSEGYENAIDIVKRGGVNE